MRVYSILQHSILILWNVYLNFLLFIYENFGLFHEQRASI